jgi:putative aminopeptidase FrvX
MQFLKKLCNTPGSSGYEEPIRSLIIDEMTPMVDSVKTDQLGNVIGFKKGRGKNKVMLAAHMDEIGFVVSFIDDSGFLRIQPTGGFDPRTMMAQRVIVHGKKALLGVMGSKPIHILKEEERKKTLEVTDYFIDLGLPVEQVKKLVAIGNPITMDRTFGIMGDCVTAKAFDDRVGVYCMMEAVRKVKKHHVNIYVVATTQEEVGLRGAFASSSGIEPNVGIALDVTLANDVPGAQKHEYVSELGKGVAISVLNGSAISNPKLVQEFKDLAEKHKFPYQLDILPRGGTDAGAMQRVKGGAAVVTLSIPTRYVHSTVETCHKVDIQATIDLLAVYLTQASDKDYFL